MNRSESIIKIAAAMHAMQETPMMAAELSDNPFFKTKYADLQSVWNACRQKLHDNGLSIIQTVNTGLEGTVLETTLLHTSGEWVSSIYPVTPKVADPQGYGSAITYARRYALAALVGVIAGDDDAEQAVGRKEGANDSEATKDALAAVTGDEGAGYKAGDKTFDRKEWIGYVTTVAHKYKLDMLKDTTKMKHSDLQQYGMEVLQAASAAKKAAAADAANNL
jgi:hypothetical protein